MKLFVILFVFLLGTVVAYEQYIGNARHPDYPEKCYHNDIKRPYEFGEVYRPVNTGSCQKITCRNDYVLRIDSCPRYQVGEGCKVISSDYSKPFPKCCPSIACPDKTGKIHIKPTMTEPDTN